MLLIFWTYWKIQIWQSAEILADQSNGFVNDFYEKFCENWIIIVHNAARFESTTVCKPESSFNTRTPCVPSTCTVSENNWTRNISAKLLCLHWRLRNIIKQSIIVFRIISMSRCTHADTVAAAVFARIRRRRCWAQLNYLLLMKNNTTETKSKNSSIILD